MKSLFIILITIMAYNTNFSMDTFDITGFDRVQIFKILFEAAREKKYELLNTKIDSQNSFYTMADKQLLLPNSTIKAWNSFTEKQKCQLLENTFAENTFTYEEQYIDYFLSVPIKVDFAPNIIDLSLYNREYGASFGQNVLQKKLNNKN